jgi:small subunit ribosomal protein S20
MPLIRSAIKKMRQDKARTKVNQAKRLVLKKTLKVASVSVSAQTLSSAYSTLDRMAKKGLIHKNKAARQKAALAKLAAKAGVTASPKAKAAKKVTKTTKAKVKTSSKV